MTCDDQSRFKYSWMTVCIDISKGTQSQALLAKQAVTPLRKRGGIGNRRYKKKNKYLSISLAKLSKQVERCLQRPRAPHAIGGDLLHKMSEQSASRDEELFLGTVAKKKEYIYIE